MYYVELNSYSRLHQIRQNILLEGYKVLAHVAIAYRSEGEAEHNAFAARDEETQALHIIAVPAYV